MGGQILSCALYFQGTIRHWLCYSRGHQLALRVSRRALRLRRQRRAVGGAGDGRARRGHAQPGGRHRDGAAGSGRGRRRGRKGRRGAEERNHAGKSSGDRMGRRDWRKNE